MKKCIGWCELNLVIADLMACVGSSLCYGWTKVEVECFQGKGKGRNITCHWRYRLKYRYTATHFETRPDIGVSVHHEDPVVFSQE